LSTAARAELIDELSLTLPKFLTIAIVVLLRKKKMIQETKYYSKLLGQLPKGCKQCVRGEKLVIFVTGVCPQKCFYCPISPNKQDKDITYANERLVKKDDDLIAEAKDNSAKGAGFTGGDPLARLERTCNYLKLLKKEFGKSFHCHLYTPLILVTEDSLKKLYDSGLDEIRFHPDFENQKGKKDWKKMLLASKFDWDVGVEIPVLPDKLEEMKELVDFIAKNSFSKEKNGFKFLNLNELEVSELCEEAFEKRDYKIKETNYYGVEGSEEVAIELMKYVEKKGYEFDVHYCTCTLKDKVQMGNRLKLRAKNLAKSFDRIVEDSLLFRGAIYLNMIPDSGYEKRMEFMSEEEKKKEIVLLKELFDNIKKKLHKEDKDLFLDEHKPRILISAKYLENNYKKILKLEEKATCTTVLEYPTYDSFPLEIDFLGRE